MDIKPPTPFLEVNTRSHTISSARRAGDRLAETPYIKGLSSAGYRPIAGTVGISKKLEAIWRQRHGPKIIYIPVVLVTNTAICTVVAATGVLRDGSRVPMLAIGDIAIE
jgi:hypothetical protein